MKLQIVKFLMKKTRIQCGSHGIQKVVLIPNPTPKERGGIMCEKCAENRKG